VDLADLVVDQDLVVDPALVALAADPALADLVVDPALVALAVLAASAVHQVYQQADLAELTVIVDFQAQADLAVEADLVVEADLADLVELVKADSLALAVLVECLRYLLVDLVDQVDSAELAVSLV
jgi:hypothetical protein